MKFQQIIGKAKQDWLIMTSYMMPIEGNRNVMTTKNLMTSLT